MRIPNVSSNPVQQTSPDTVNRTLSDFIKIHSNYKGREFVICSTSKTAQSFLTLAKTFFSGLFRRNPDLHLQRTPSTIFMPTPEMTTIECEQLWQFDYATEHILSTYAETYAETLSDPESQIFKKAQPALIANFGKDFLEKFHEIHALPFRKKMPMADMLYQALGAIEFRRGTNDCAGVKGFSRFMERPETAKAFESWLGSYTQIFKPEKAAIAKAPDQATYRDFSMEKDLSQKNTQSFLTRAMKGVINQLPVIRDLRLFRPSTKRRKPHDVGNLTSVSAAYGTLLNQRAQDVSATKKQYQRLQDVSNTKKQFVKDFETNYPEIWPKLKSCEKKHLEVISATPSARIMSAFASQGVSRSPLVYGPGGDPGTSRFSAEFLTTMRSLESKIVTAIGESAEKTI